jgi:hypothetical protein
MHLSTHKWVEDAIRLTDYCKRTMALSRKRRRRREQRRRHEIRPAPRTSPAPGPRDEVPTRFLPERAVRAARRRQSPLAAPQESSPGDDGLAEAPPAVPSPGLREAQKVERLAYTRRQAAEALGAASRRSTGTWFPPSRPPSCPGASGSSSPTSSIASCEGTASPARGRRARRTAGRPQTLPRSVVERIRLEYARGRGLSEIARALTAEGVPTAHGALKWWPSTIRAVLCRPSA